MKMESLLSLGILLIFIGIIIIFVSSIFLSTQQKSNVKVAAGGIIGFIPFGFFTDKKMFYIWLVFIAVIIIIYFILKKTL